MLTKSCHGQSPSVPVFRPPHIKKRLGKQGRQPPPRCPAAEHKILVNSPGKLTGASTKGLRRRFHVGCPSLALAASGVYPRAVLRASLRLLRFRRGRGHGRAYRSLPGGARARVGNTCETT